MTCGRRDKSHVIRFRRNNKYLHIYRRNRNKALQEGEDEAIRKRAQGATINSPKTPLARSEANKTTLPSNSYKAPNVITGIATRTIAPSHAELKSTTLVSNETQRHNVFIAAL